jgi:hypothetical protein
VAVQKVPVFAGLDVLQMRLGHLVLIQTIKHHGKATIRGVGATNKLGLAIKLLVEETRTESNTDVVHIQVIPQVFVKIKVLRKDACAPKADVVALVSVWILSQHIAVL